VNAGGEGLIAYLKHCEAVGAMPADQEVMPGFILQVCGDLPKLGVIGAVDGIVGKVALVVIAMKSAMPRLKVRGFGAPSAFSPWRGQPLFDKVARRGSDRIDLLHDCAVNFEMTNCLMRVAVVATSGREFNPHVFGLNYPDDGRVSFVIQDLALVEERHGRSEAPDAIVDLSEGQAASAGPERQDQPIAAGIRIGDLNGMQGLREISVR
jgi:hypothetical protein